MANPYLVGKKSPYLKSSALPQSSLTNVTPSASDKVAMAKLSAPVSTRTSSGGSSKTKATSTGFLGTIKNVYSSIDENIFSGLLPWGTAQTVTSKLAAFGSKITGAVSGYTDWWQKEIVETGAAFKNIYSDIGSGIGGFVGGAVGGSLAGTGQGLGAGLAGVGEGLGAGVAGVGSGLGWGLGSALAGTGQGLGAGLGGTLSGVSEGAGKSTNLIVIAGAIFLGYIIIKEVH